MDGVRTRNIYNPGSESPFKLSRSKIELFIDCPQCFYLDRRLGVGRPPGFPFTLNNAVDTLLKKEFDIHRVEKSKHPLMETYGVDAVPFSHPDMDKWRQNFVGAQYLHEPTNLIITGAVDDIWLDKEERLMIVDYKATSTEGEITLESEYRQAYKRQMEIYQWIYRRLGFNVSNTGYFVYANGKTDPMAFDAKLEFDIKLLRHDGDDSWVEPKIIELHKTLNEPSIPNSSEKCEYCTYRNAVKSVL